MEAKNSPNRRKTRTSKHERAHHEELVLSLLDPTEETVDGSDGLLLGDERIEDGVELEPGCNLQIPITL